MDLKGKGTLRMESGPRGRILRGGTQDLEDKGGSLDPGAKGVSRRELGPLRDSKDPPQGGSQDLKINVRQAPREKRLRSLKGISEI